MSRLQGKVALVTGAAAGFGEAIARLFVAEGAKVLLADLDGAKAQLLAEALGPAARAVACDVSRQADVQAAVAACVESFGTPDVVVNNAGTTHRNQSMLEVDESTFDRVFAVNVKSIFHMTRAVVPLMQARRSGCIVNIGSTAGIRPRPGLAWYNASKGAVNLLSKSMAAELGPDGIRVADNGARLEFRLFGRSDSPTSKKAVEYIKRYLADVGIAANVTLISEDALTEKIGQGEFDMFEWGWVVEPDPNYQLSTFTCARRSYEDGGSVLAGLSDSFYCNPEYDKLFAAQGSETDVAKRVEIVKQMQQILYDDWPYAITYYYDNLVAYRSDRFEGFIPQPDPNGSYLFQYGTWTYKNLKPVAAGAGQSGGPSPALVGGIVAAVAVLGGLAFLLLRRRRAGAADDRE